MATAKRTGGLYWVNGKPVDANGVEVADAPPRDADTVVDPNLAHQSDAQRTAEAIGRAIGAEMAKLNARAAPDHSQASKK